MKPREIEVHIEELILHGFEPANRWLVADALEQELRGLLGLKGVPFAWLSSPQRIEGGKLSSANLTLPAQTGAAIARATYRGRVK